jgi:hypothetical protein
VINDKLKAKILAAHDHTKKTLVVRRDEKQARIDRKKARQKANGFPPGKSPV